MHYCKKMKKKKSTKGKKSPVDELMHVDPRRIRVQYSRIRPYFSGCGRSVQETLDDIRMKKVSVVDLPPIQVLVGEGDEDGPWYFSLNNRRLWVIKQLREEGLLEGGVVGVRVREAKSEAERGYLAICASTPPSCSRIAPFREKASFG